MGSSIDRAPLIRVFAGCEASLDAQSERMGRCGSWWQVGTRDKDWREISVRWRGSLHHQHAAGTRTATQYAIDYLGQQTAHQLDVSQASTTVTLPTGSQYCPLFAFLKLDQLLITGHCDRNRSVRAAPLRGCRCPNSTKEAAETAQQPSK